MEHENMGALIRQLRKDRGMTQKDLAERLNVTDKAVSKWERELSLPDVALLLPLAETLGVTVTELLGGQRAPEAPPPDPAGSLLTYASRTAPQRRERLRLRLAWGITGVFVLGALVCWICDMALNRRLTWSLLVDLSLALVWAVLLPLLTARRRGPEKALAALSAGILPYLYLLGALLGEARVFRLGLPIAPAAAAYLWALWWAVRRLQRRPWLAGGAVLGLSALLRLYVNGVVPALAGAGTLLGGSVPALILAGGCCAADRIARRGE